MPRLPLLNITGTPFKRILAHNASIVKPYDELFKSVEQSLSPEIVDLVRMRVSSNNGCEY